MKLSEVRKIIEKKGIHTVELGFADIHGILRGKRLPSRHFLKIAETGSALAKAPFVWDIQCAVFPGPELANFHNGFPDMVAKPILSTFRQVPWREGSAFVLCDLFETNGDAIAVSPREVLKKIISRANSLSLRPKIGSELEFYLLDQDKKPLFNGIQCYSLYRGAELEYVIGEMRTGLEEFGVELEAFHVEYGPAQIEVIPEYDDALAMADKTVLIKNAVKEIARKHGLYASFMPKIWADESGNGYHVHQSLWDLAGKSSLFAHNRELAQHYLAGLVHTAKEFMLFGSPTVNSYKRFKDHSFAPVNASWGDDNRTVATRQLGAGDNIRFEHRTGSADANPYLIIAAGIAAGLYGIEQKLAPPDVTRRNAYLLEDEPLPATLEEGLKALQESKVAREYFGEEFISLYLSIGRHEAALYRAAVTDWERERYLEMA